MDSQVRTVTISEQTPVEVPAIEKELAKLWAEAAGTGLSVVLRACALNLLIYTSEQITPEDASRIIAEVTPEHPSRAIILTCKADGGPAIEALVSAHCNLMGGGVREICCEQIILEARGTTDARDFANAALQQISPELPVILWWTGNPPLGSPDLVRLTQVADRLLIDSSQFRNPSEQTAREVELIHNLEITAVLGDLNWARLTPWRELTAQFFDRVENRHYLNRLEKVEIRCENHLPSSIVQASLYAGWLASRLGWEFISREVLSDLPDRAVIFHNIGRTVTVQFSRNPLSHQAPGELVSVILTAGGTPGARFSIGCNEDKRCALTRVEIDGKMPVERMVPMEPRSLGELLGEELEVLSRDRIFEAALEMAAKIMS